MQPTLIRDDDIRPGTRRVEEMPPSGPLPEGLHVNPVDTLHLTLHGVPAIATRIVLEAEDLRRIASGETTFWFVAVADHLHPMLLTFDHPVPGD